MTFTHTMIETPHVFMNMHKKKIIQIIGHGEFSSIWMWPWQISTWVYWHRKLKAGQEWNLLSTITQTPKDGHNNSLKVTHARTHARTKEESKVLETTYNDSMYTEDLAGSLNSDSMQRTDLFFTLFTLGLV